MNNNNYSGRIQISKSLPPKSYEEPPKMSGNNKHKNLKNVSSNLLNKTFFSSENIEIIQNNIRHSVWSKSNHKFVIAPQSETQIEIIMRSIYLQYSKNLSYNIKEQIEELNNLVLTECVPNIMSNIKQYIGYKQDLNSGPTFMDHPKNVSSAGSKSLVNNLF